MEFNSNALFDDVLPYNNSLEMNFSREYLKLSSLYPGDNRKSYNEFDLAIASSDRGPLDDLGLIHIQSAFDESGQVPSPHNDLKDFLFSPPSGIAQRRALQRTNHDASRKAPLDSGEDDHTRLLLRTSTDTGEVKCRSEKSITTVVEKRRPRKKERKSTPDKTVAKRRRRLEKNRTAAGKCRRKKREETDRLQERKARLEAENLSLELELADVWDQVTTLKNVMMHASCNHLTLSSWAENEKIFTAFVDSDLGPLNPDLIEAEPVPERSGNSLTLAQATTTSHRADIASEEQGSPESNSSASSVEEPY